MCLIQSADLKDQRQGLVNIIINITVTCNASNVMASRANI